MSEFQREDRYIVIKRSDMDKAPAELRRSFSTQCRKLHDGMFKHGAPARQFVVVESDWPEYHLVWAMLEHRMAGKPVPNFNDWRRADELQQRLNAADQRNAELTSALEGMVEYFPEGHSDGECFSVERANLALGRPNDCVHDWFPDHCLKCGITKP